MTYSDEVKAQALALLKLRNSSYQVERQLEEIFPGNAPSNQTIREWRRELAESSDEQIEDSARRIALKADALIEQAIDQIAEQSKDDKSVLVKNLAILNIVAGTKTDKVIAAKRVPSQTLNVGQAVIIIERAEPSQQ